MNKISYYRIFVKFKKSLAAGFLALIIYFFISIKVFDASFLNLLMIELIIFTVLFIIELFSYFTKRSQ